MNLHPVLHTLRMKGKAAGTGVPKLLGIPQLTLGGRLFVSLSLLANETSGITHNEF
jgi:hypothetical protein